MLDMSLSLAFVFCTKLERINQSHRFVELKINLVYLLFRKFIFEKIVKRLKLKFETS